MHLYIMVQNDHKEGKEGVVRHPAMTVTWAGVYPAQGTRRPRDGSSKSDNGTHVDVNQGSRLELQVVNSEGAESRDCRSALLEAAARSPNALLRARKSFQ